MRLKFDFSIYHDDEPDDETKADRRVENGPCLGGQRLGAARATKAD